MTYIKVDNAIIMAAGMASRFVPISNECPKALLEVKGEILIERQIRQLIEAGVVKIVVVVGYMKERFAYLQEKFGVTIVANAEYATRNNHSSIYAVKKYLKNSYICSADNYFSTNPFKSAEKEAFYSAVYVSGPTKEWCITTNTTGDIIRVDVSGSDAWIMLGHVFWTQEFSERFLEILEGDYNTTAIKDKLWEAIYLDNIDVLKLKMKKYDDNIIYEFDSLKELEEFDVNYRYNCDDGVACKMIRKGDER